MTNQTHTILAVDDEPINLRMLQRLLRGHFNVVIATNGVEALKILEQTEVSLIITDQRMPGMLGTELLRKSREINPDLVKIVLTANNDADTFIDAIKNSGAIRVINKPWDPDQVLQMVREAIAKYERNMAHKQTMDRLKQINKDLNRIAGRH